MKFGNFLEATQTFQDLSRFQKAAISRDKFDTSFRAAPTALSILLFRSSGWAKFFGLRVRPQCPLPRFARQRALGPNRSSVLYKPATLQRFALGTSIHFGSGSRFALPRPKDKNNVGIVFPVPENPIAEKIRTLYAQKRP